MGRHPRLHVRVYDIAMARYPASKLVFHNATSRKRDIRCRKYHARASTHDHSFDSQSEAQLLKSLSDARDELRRMHDAGLGARYDGVPSEVRSFQRNQRLFEELTCKLNRAKQQLIEAKVRALMRLTARACD